MKNINIGLLEFSDYQEELRKLINIRCVVTEQELLKFGFNEYKDSLYLHRRLNSWQSFEIYLNKNTLEITDVDIIDEYLGQYSILKFSSIKTIEKIIKELIENKLFVRKEQ